MNKKLPRQLAWLVLLIVATVWIVARHREPATYLSNHGRAFGTLYNITYCHTADLQTEIDSVLRIIDFSLSPFNDSSTIARINRGEDVVPDTFFLRVFERSMEISRATGGAFDITVAPLVNAWGFGFQAQAFPDGGSVDSLLAITGYDRVSLSADGRVVKADPRMMLTGSAVAKGYAVDLVARMLAAQGIEDYMVEIGGEVSAHGVNTIGLPWRIGVNKPLDDSLSLNRDLQTILSISGASIATSGNYRNFYYRDGRKYAHTIDPRTGYPVDHSLLSSTVIAPDCMTADALATAFMVMGVDSALTFANGLTDIEAYFVYQDDDGAMQFVMTDGMEGYIAQ